MHDQCAAAVDSSIHLLVSVSEKWACTGRQSVWTVLSTEVLRLVTMVHCETALEKDMQR